MVGANVHNKVKVSSHCLLNSCLDIPKWSRVIGRLVSWSQGSVFSDSSLYIYVFSKIMEYLKLEETHKDQIQLSPLHMTTLNLTIWLRYVLCIFIQI